MKIIFYHYQTEYSKIPLPVCLPGNTLFPSGDLPGLGGFEYVIHFLPGNSRETAGKSQEGPIRNQFWTRIHDIEKRPSGLPSGSRRLPFREASGNAGF